MAKYHFESGIVSNLLCSILVSGWPSISGIVTSTINLEAITIERYLLICHPVLHRNLYSRKKAFIVAISLWFIVFFCCIPTMLTTRVFNGECLRFEFWLNPALKSAYWLALAVAMGIVPVVFFTICYAKIFLAIQRRNKMKQNNTLHLHDPNRKYHLASKEKNILKTMVIVTTCFVVCYLPIFVKFVLVGLGVISQFGNNIMNDIPRPTLFSNCCINPFIYIFQFEIFQQELKKYILGVQALIVQVHP